MIKSEFVNFLDEDEKLEEDFVIYNKLSNKIDDMHLNDDDSMAVIHIIVSKLIDEKEKNIDTIQELVNIIREAIKYIENNDFINVNKLLYILNKYREN